MQLFSDLAHGFAVAMTPMHLLWALIGTTLGTAIGVLPGLGPALTTALPLPPTFQSAPPVAFLLFGGIYFGSMFGAPPTSSLLNTPGATPTTGATLDIHPHAPR